MKNFKKLLSLICVLAVVMGCFSAIPVTVNAEETQAVTEYVPNGTFDNGKNGWTTRYGESYSSVLTDNGNNFLKLNAYYGGFYKYDIQLPGGKIYKLNFRAKADASHSTFLKLYHFFEDGSNEVIIDETIKLETGFKTYSFAFQVDADNAGTYGFAFGDFSGKGYDSSIQYLDNISIVEINSKQYVPNGTFDNSKDGWTTRYGEDKSQILTDNGNKFIKIAPYYGGFYRADIVLPAGKTYELSFSGMADTAHSTFVGLIYLKADGTNETLLNESVALEAGFKKYTYTISIPEGKVGMYQLRFGNFSGATDTANQYLDNISITEVTEERVPNGTFDDGKDGWTVNYERFDSTAYSEILTDNGNKFIKLFPYNGGFYKYDISLSGGKIYKLNFRAMADATHNTTLTLYHFFDDGSNEKIIEETVKIETGFKTYSFAFSVEEDMGGTYGILFGGQNSTNEYLDDISILEIKNNQYVPNGTFDNSKDGWTTRYGEDKSQILTDNGNKFIKIAPYYGGFYRADIVLPAGKTYELSFSGMADTAHSTFVGLIYLKADGTNETLLNESVALEAGFKKYTYTFKIPEGKVGMYQLRFGDFSSDGDKYNQYLDNISISMLTIEPPTAEFKGSEEADIYESESGEFICNVPYGWATGRVIALYECTNATVTADTTGAVKTGTVFTASADGEVLWTKQAVVLGDLNGDADISVLDFIAMKKYLSQTKELDGAYFEAGRFSGDSDIISDDLTYLTKVLLGVVELGQKKNLTYLENTYSKLVSGETVHIAFVGGSVTQGMGATNSTGWPTMVVNSLKETYDADCVEHRQAIGGTGSLLDVFRFDYDNAEAAPDLLFIEFAINDSYKRRTTEQVMRDSETIVRKAYAKNPYVDIVYVFTFNSGVKAEEYEQLLAHKAVADKYGFMTIALGPKFYDYISKTGEKFEDYFTDTVHPNDRGYDLYGEFITEALYEDMPKVVNADSSYTAKELPELPSNVMIDARIVTADNIDISEATGWNYSSNKFAYVGTKYGGYISSTTAGSTLTFTFEGTAGGFLYERNTNLGKVSVSIDGGTPIIIDGYASYQPDYYVFEDLEDTVHTVTITKLEESNASSTGNEFRIGALLLGK